MIALMLFSFLSYSNNQDIVYKKYISYYNKKITINEIDYIIKYIKLDSKEYGIPIELVLAIMKTESNFNFNIYSQKNAFGYMQIMDILANELKMNKYNRRENIRIGIKYLKMCIDSFGGINNNAIAAYNRGISGVKRNGYLNVKETREYVNKVLREYKILNELKRRSGDNGNLQI